MKGIHYSRIMVIWLSIGILLLDGFLIHLLLTSPFEVVYLLLGWLILGLNFITAYGLSRLWDTDVTRI